jgi:hypothetical protein
MSLKCPGTGNHELNGPGNYSSHQFFVRVRPGNHFTSFLWAWELGSQGFPLTLTTATVQCCLFAAHNQPTSLAFHVFKYLTRLFKHWLQLESCTGMRILPVPNRTRGLHTRPQPYPWTSHPYPSPRLTFQFSPPTNCLAMKIKPLR